MTGDLVTRVATLVQSALKGDAGLGSAPVSGRVYYEQGPQGGPFPFIRHDDLALVDTTALGGQRCHAETVWLVALEAGTASPLGLQTAADRVDAVLHNQTLTGQGLQVYWIRQDSNTTLEVEDGLNYRSLMLRYRGLIQDG